MRVQVIKGTVRISFDGTYEEFVKVWELVSHTLEHQDGVEEGKKSKKLRVSKNAKIPPPKAVLKSGDDKKLSDEQRREKIAAKRRAKRAAQKKKKRAKSSEKKVRDLSAVPGGSKGDDRKSKRAEEVTGQPLLSTRPCQSVKTCLQFKRYEDYLYRFYRDMAEVKNLSHMGVLKSISDFSTIDEFVEDMHDWIHHSPPSIPTLFKTWAEQHSIPISFCGKTVDSVPTRTGK